MERDDPIDRLRTARPDADLSLLRRAYEVAARGHDGQFRQSGEPYISHPVMVASILARLGADDQTLCAAILHDTVQYTPFTLTMLRQKFGGGVAAMVAEHMMLDHIGHRPGLGATRAVAIIGSVDRRVAMLKMADRLHYVRTLAFLPTKQLRKAREVLDVFAPA